MGRRLVALVVAMFVAAGFSLAGEMEANELVYRGLHQRVSWDFRDLSLGEFAQRLTHDTAFPVLVDGSALAEADLPKNIALSAECRDELLGDALWQVLRPWDLAVRISAGSLWITSADESQRHLLVRRYDLPENHAEWADEYGNCVLVPTLIAPDTWDEVGGVGSERMLNAKTLLVSNTPEVHWEIDDLLARLATGEQKSPRELRLDQQLRAPAPVGGSIETLSDLVQWLRAQGIDARLEEREFEDLGLDGEEHVVVQPQGASVEDVLRQAVDGYELAWLRHGDTLLLTSADEAANSLEVRVYDVSQLELSGDDLANVLSYIVAPDSWDEVGGRGSQQQTTYLGRKLLVVSQTQAVHAEVAALLDRLPRGTTPAAIVGRRVERKYLKTPAWNTPRVFTADGQNRPAPGSHAVERDPLRAPTGGGSF